MRLTQTFVFIYSNIRILEYFKYIKLAKVIKQNMEILLTTKLTIASNNFFFLIIIFINLCVLYYSKAIVKRYFIISFNNFILIY